MSHDHLSAFISSFSINTVFPRPAPQRTRRDHMAAIAAQIAGRDDAALTHATRRYDAFLRKHGVALGEADYRRAHAYLRAIVHTPGVGYGIGAHNLATGERLMRCALHAAARHHGDAAGHLQHTPREPTPLRNGSMFLYRNVAANTDE